MAKRVFIIHGWEGYPEEGWFPWLKKELEAKGFEVYVPAMPNTNEPEINAWISCLAKQVGHADEGTFFVGHSIGCQAILRYLESLPENQKVGGAVFVAGWVNLFLDVIKEEEGDESSCEIAKPWLETPIKWGKILSHTKNFAAIFSDNDRYVPLKDKEIFREKLNAKIIVEHEKGHFRGSDGIVALPVVLNELLKMATPE